MGSSLTRASAEHPAHLCLQPVDQRGNIKQNKLNDLFCLSSPSRLEVTGKGELGALRTSLRMQLNLAIVIRQQDSVQTKQVGTT